MIGYLLDPAIQIQDTNGVTIAGARIYIYNHNTSDLAETYKDFNGTRNTNPVITDTLGNCTVIAEDGILYDIVYKDAQDNLLFTKENVSVNQGSSSSGNVQVVAGYGIDVTPSVSAGVQKYEVAIDPAIVETFDSITKYEAGDNIVLNNLPNNTKSINLANEVILSESNYLSKLNTKQNSFTNTSANKGSIQDAAGFYVSNLQQTTYTDIGKDYILSTDGSATIGWQLGNNSITVWNNSGNGNYGNLHLGLDDVLLEEQHPYPTPDKVYSLTGACTSAQSALAAVITGDLTHYSAGANVNITNHVVSAKNWTNDIQAATSGKLDITATANWDVSNYSAGSNINITNHVVSGKDWSSTINSATSGKLNTSTFNTYTAAHTADDVTPYSAGANVNITSHVISGKDWSNDILAAASGKIDKVAGGAGSETNPVYLNASNIVTPCFSDSVKLAKTVPSYFSADAGGNVMIYAPGGSHKADDSIKNTIFITHSDNFMTPSTTDIFENCIYMGIPYMYSPSNAGTCHYRKNILIGNNSISDAKDESNENTIIGNENDLIGNRGASSHKFQSTTVVGYQNNSYTDTYATTIIGCYNDVGNPSSPSINNKEVQVSIFGYNNEFTYDTTNGSPSYGLIVGINNNVENRENYKTCTIGFDNNLTGNCTFLIGDSLSATNEGSYADKIMKIGFGSCHLEIHSSGIIYKVVNGVKTQI